MSDLTSGLYREEKHQPFQLGSGPTGALLLHGFPGTPAELRPLGEKLARAGWSVTGPLLPGFGPQIAKLGEQTRFDWLAAAGEQWQKIQATHQTSVLIGFSMGGALALNVAAQQRPSFLVLLAPFWRFASWQANLLLPIVKHFQKVTYPFADADFRDTAVRQQLRDIFPDADLDSPDVQEEIRQKIQLPTKIIDEVRLLGKSGGKLAPMIKSPTLVLQGSDDAIVLPRHSRQLITKLPGRITYREISGTHSFPEMVPPNQYDFTPDILNFVNA